LDDTVLQDEPLLVRVLDDRSSSSNALAPSGTLGPDESLGVAYVDLNPLLTTRANDYWHDDEAAKGSSTGGKAAGDEEDSNSHGMPRPSSPDPPRPFHVGSPWDPERSGSLAYTEGRDGSGGVLPGAYQQQRGVTTIEGWLPLYDTLQGVRGEVLVSIKLNLIGDVNPFRDSSAGVRLLPFSTLDPASGYAVRHIFGARGLFCCLAAEVGLAEVPTDSESSIAPLFLH
jgi:hypothetical protein